MDVEELSEVKQTDGADEQSAPTPVAAPTESEGEKSATGEVVEESASSTEESAEVDKEESNPADTDSEAESPEERLASLKRARQGLADVTQKFETMQEDLGEALPDNGGSVLEDRRADVSASTIARMMGLVTATEFRLLEGKLDLMLTRLASVQTKLDGVNTRFQMLPTGHDLERIDVQVGALRTLIKEALSKAVTSTPPGQDVHAKKIRAGIVSNTKSDGEG